MRAALLVVALAVAGSGCGIKSVTREDRVAASVAASRMKHGTVLTEGQVDMLDKDATYQCQREKRTGTNVPQLTCRSLRRVESDVAQAQGLRVKAATQGVGGGSAE